MTTTQLDRIEGRVQSIDDRMRAIEIKMGELKGEEKAHHWAASVFKSALPGIIGFLAGMFGGHTPLPGGH